MISGVSGCEGPGGIAEIDLKVALNMGSKLCGNTKAEATDQAASQKLTLKLPSVWGAKCVEIHVKINDFWGQRVRWTRRLRRNRP